MVRESVGEPHSWLGKLRLADGHIDSLVCHKNKYEREKMQWSRVQFSFVQDQKISVSKPDFFTKNTERLTTQYYIMLFIWKVMKNLSSDIDYETRKYWTQVLQIVREGMMSSVEQRFSSTNR